MSPVSFENNIPMLLFRFFSCLILGFSVSSQTFSQERVALNRHFFEIEEKSEESSHFTRIENQLGTGERVIWIFDLNNRMVQQSKIGMDPEGNYQQEITERFDSLNNKISQTILNLENSKSVTAYFENGVKKAEVFRQDEYLFEIWRLENDTLYTSSYDEFKPSVDPESLNRFFAKNLTYPLSARRAGLSGIAIVAVLVSEEGNVKEIELANGVQIHKILGEEAVRVVKLFKGPYRPAIDLVGKPIEAWLYIPVRFKLG